MIPSPDLLLCSDASLQHSLLKHALLRKEQSMPSRIDRRTVDLSEYPNLVVIYLGLRVRKFAGIKRLFGLGPQIAKAGQARPEGLLHCDNGIHL